MNVFYVVIISILIVLLGRKLTESLKYLADAQNFQFEIFDTLDPPFSIVSSRILEKPKIENFSDDVFKFFPSVSAMDPDQNTKSTTLNMGRCLKYFTHTALCMISSQFWYSFDPLVLF